jgi:hypothetical protein
MAAGIYAALTRLVFGANGITELLFSTFSLGFLFLVPLALGALTVFFAPKKFHTSLVYAIFMPWVSSLVFVLLAALAAVEAGICVLMAAPIFMLMSTVGGLAMALIFYLTRSKDATQSANLALVLFLVSPYIVTPLELRVPLATEIRQTHRQIEIQSSPEKVWDQIANFPLVAPQNQRETLFHILGLPRPIQATLSFPGLGAVRRGDWEYGLAFDGVVTDWVPNERYTVQLNVDTRSITPEADVLRSIGGDNFDMVDDSYVIERVSADRVVLHLYSTYRLTSHFNAYGALWTDFLMRDIQNYLLQIVKQRCETPS